MPPSGRNCLALCYDVQSLRIRFAAVGQAKRVGGFVLSALLPTVAPPRGSAVDCLRLPTRRPTAYLPRLYSIEGDRKYYRNRAFAEREVWLAEID